MKNKIFNKTLAVFLTFILVLGLLPSIGFAQAAPASPLGEIKGFNISVFDSHFSRANRELSPDRWLIEAKLGVTQAISAWELIACTLYENPLVFEEAKARIEKWSNEELEARFSQWLIGRFFGEAAEKALTEFSAMFGENQKNFSWRLDDEGNIVFDDKTGDPLVIRPGEDGREFQEDLLKWRREAEVLVKTNSDSFNGVMIHLYPELLAFIPEELRETMSSVIQESGTAVSEAIKREFENIAAREERIFTSRRTMDIWSLRKKSDDEAARIFTERLIAETEESCARGIEEITVKIEEASADTGDLAMLGEEWLSLYKEQFDRGLKAWEEAEERFFIRRIEWEQDSLRLFSQGDETWLAAFKKFEEERQKWELKVKELFQSGESLFKSISDNLEKNIEDAKQEFEINMAMRIGAGTAKAKALVDMYLVCASAAITAKENIQFWQNQYNEDNKRDPAEPGFIEWLDYETALSLAKEEDADTSRSSYNALDEIRKSYNLYVSYMEKAVDARDRILADYAELIGTGALKDILSPGASSEDFFLDEYQVALIRAKTLVLYWERKTAVAEAIMTYAGEIDAGRMTEAEGIWAWEGAKTAYNESLAAYETELRRLNVIGDDIHRQQEILNNLAQEMQETEEKLNRLNKDYSVFIAANITDIEDFVLLDFNNKYDLLAEGYRNFMMTGANAVYKNIFENGVKWEISEQRETAGNYLNIMINGDDEEMPSLAELENNVLENAASEIYLRIRLAGIDLFADSPDGQLRPIDSSYSSADWYSKAKRLTLSENEKSALYGGRLSVKLIEDYKNSFRILLEKRIEFELKALLDFLGEESELDEESAADSQEYVQSELYPLDTETAQKIYEILFKLNERLLLRGGYFTEDEEENEIINFFILGSSFFTGSEQYLAAYFDEYHFCSGLLDLYNDYASSSLFIQEEMRHSTNNSLNMLFTEYSLATGGNFLPDAQSVLNSISEMTGDFTENAARFLMKFDKCFSLIPQWLEAEKNNWTTAMIEYMAANALSGGIQPVKDSQTLAREQAEMNTGYQYGSSLKLIDDNETERITAESETRRDNENLLYYMYQITRSWEKFNNNAITAENEKHWRQFLEEDILTNFDPAISHVLSWNEGVLADMLFNAVYFTNRVNDAAVIFSHKNSYTANGNADLSYNLYKDEALRIDRHFYSLKLRYNEIDSLGRAYAISRMSGDELKEQLEAHYAILRTQEEAFNEIKNEYLAEAETFLNTGILYDGQYAVLKNAYYDTDEKRFEYEKQDAVRRWASTAYLNTGGIDVGDCKNKLTKAQTVLAVLSDLFGGGNTRTYNNPEYNALYLEYEQSFSRKLKILDVIESVFSETSYEYVNNENLFSSYQNSLNKLGYVDRDYSNYASPVSRDDWSAKDIITIKDGLLAFSRDDSMNLSGVDDSMAGTLDNYFNAALTPDNEQFGISGFDEALRGLAQRMAGYLTDDNKFRQWSMARDNLITSLIKANEDINFLKDCFIGLGEAGWGGNVGSLRDISSASLFKKNEGHIASLFNDWFPFGRRNPFLLGLETECRTAWEELSDEERADLEFYVILTLSGNGNDYLAGFSQMYTLDVYDYAYRYICGKYSYARDKSNLWYDFGIHNEMRDVNYNTMRSIEPVLNQTQEIVQNWIHGLQENLNSIQRSLSAYTASCERLSSINVERPSGQNIIWNEINQSLLASGKTKNEDIAMIKIFWEKMQAESAGSFESVPEALTGLLRWAKNAEDKSREELERLWFTDEQNRKNNEYDYQMAEEAFIAGIIGMEELRAAAERAYENNVPVRKDHLDKMHITLLNDLSLYLAVNNDFFTEFGSLGDEIALSTAKIMESRYNAELAAREIEWNQMRRDISERHLEWLDSAAQILENGRADWDAGVQKMEDAYRQWNINFKNEYNRVSAEWAEAYLAGLEDKENWLEKAAAAAYDASAESFLSLVGAEGERLSRFIDTREPFGIRGAAPEAETLMAGLLQASGISNVINAFSILNNNIAGAASPLVRRGMGGISTWDASIVKMAASDLARRTNAEIANSETRKLARNASLSVDEAIKSLAANVELANKNFRDSMDNYFIMNGLWRKNGNSYVKDIITGSTLFQPVISETAVITGYRNYTMEPISLKTNMDENYLAGLDSIVIRGLLENIINEVEAYKSEIFGIGADSIKINKQVSIVMPFLENSTRQIELEEREQSPGKFGAHIGYQPAVKPPNEMGSSRNSLFYDEGEGELGRLISEYIYWAVIYERGNAELDKAPWDKRMWNDQNSSFKAPSLRETGQVIGAAAGAVVSIVATPFTGGASLAGMVGVMAVVAAVNTVDDFVFGALDAHFGYKTLDEAAFEVGKSLLINTASSVASGFFGGIGGTANTIAARGLTGVATNAVSGAASKIMVQTAMSGLQTATTTLVTSAISGITYNSQDGLGYSGEIFNAGAKGILTNTLSSMVTSFTTGNLQAINSGFSLEKLESFSKSNKSDVSKFNNLAGSLAGQGINYAMGNDFTLNLLNVGLFTGGEVNSGLLELHLGRDGSPTMNIGTGGANVSIDNLAAAYRGAMVWNVNNRIDNYTKDNLFDAKNTLRALYGYGDNVQKRQLSDILKENTEIRTDADGDFKAETEIIGGKRVINLTGYKSGMSPEEQMLLAAILGHEAYRDGIVTDDNHLETRMATLAHTKMALEMLFDGQKLAYDDNLAKDISAYFKANGDMALFNDYVDNFYDSSGDYWKLVMRDGNVGFEWDGKLTYDLSIMEGYGEVEQLDENSLRDIWNLGRNNIAYVDFKSAVGMFDILNNQIRAFETILNVRPSQTAANTILDEHKNAFINALRGVEASGLLMRTDATIEDLGEGRHIFANGSRMITSDFGMRAVTWDGNNQYPYGTFQFHDGWDLGLRGNRDPNQTPKPNPNLVAPMDGSLSISFTQLLGVQLTTTGEDNKKVTYAHANGSSLRNFVEVFSYNGITLNDNGSLSGVIQNTVIGIMGNTGTLSLNPHVHLIYKEGGRTLSPELFFDRTSFGTTSYARLMSGLGNYQDNFQPTQNQAINIYNYLYKDDKVTADDNFGKFAINGKDTYLVLAHKIMLLKSISKWR